MTSTIAIIQCDLSFGEQLALTLRQDGHDVLPIATTLSEAYKNFSLYEADICVIDGNLPEEDLMRLSDMFTLMDIPHIINYNEELMLRRLPIGDKLSSSRTGHRMKSVKPPMTHAISLAVWDLHVSLQLSKPLTSLSPALSYI